MSGLYLSNYDLKNSIEIVKIETANGIIEPEVFELSTFSSLGITKKEFLHSGI